ncbi:MAG: J domain-containing protein [Chloroflexi bacterium]|nr:J domain-containing protein [Chloroflexota bacterium]MCC6895369.1 J domain-containing protein [Anaerolineae bacterium]
MDNARTQLFKKLLRDLIARFVSVQRCTLGQPSMSASPVRDVDIVVQMWAGVVIHIHVIDEAIKANKVRRIIETATDNGIPVMFLLDAALMPANKAHISLDQWYVPFQSLVDDRAYCYKVENNQPVIFPMQFRPYSRIELEVSQGAPLTISQLQHSRMSVRHSSLKGFWLLADFESDPNANVPPIRRTDYTSYQYSGPRQSFQDMPHWEKVPTGDKNKTNGSTPPNLPQKSQIELAYEVLGLATNASRDEVRAVYRKLAFELHPDVSTLPKAEAEARFKMLSEAYTFIKTTNRWG